MSADDIKDEVLRLLGINVGSTWESRYLSVVTYLRIDSVCDAEVCTSACYRDGTSIVRTGPGPIFTDAYLLAYFRRTL